MSKPSKPQFSGKNGRPYRNQYRGSRVLQNRRNRDRSSTQERQNVQPAETPQVFDWFYGELRDAEPDEIQSKNNSRSSSPCIPPGKEKFHGQSNNKNHDYHRSNSAANTQYKQEEKTPRYSKFNQLIKLSQMNGNEIATEISDEPEFKLFLNSKMRKDFIVIAIRVLAKLGQCDFKRIVINVLSDICQSKFFQNLEEYLALLPSQTRGNAKINQLYWEDVNKFWNDLHDFFKAIINFVPIEVHKTLSQILELTLRYVIESIKIKKDHEVDENIQSRFLKLHQQLMEQSAEHAEILSSKTFKNFRNLSVIPTIEDLNDFHPYIRPSKIHGTYDSVDHYLDVQFRLMREDFIFPLRNGIKEYRKMVEANVRSFRNSDIRVFQKVRLVGPTVVKNKIGMTISFGVIPKMNWNHSRLFMYGSLLCLTKDNFESVVFATVIDRDVQLLEKGKIIIEPYPEMQILREMYNFELTMVESKVYFLPYHHTLSSLRYMSEEDFPMKRYIIDAESTPHPPKYLNQTTVFLYKRFEIPVMNVQYWPSAKHLQFDDSQYEAFKSALLQELSVLQGPPGTGKTFIGLQIASILLTNSSTWYNPSQPTPMIVVCLTNHALDQFLEGILSQTESLVRIGEQSKNPNLDKYKLKVIRQNYFKDEKNNHRAWRRMKYYENQLNQLLIQLSRAYAVVRALRSNTVVVSPYVLRSYYEDDELRNLNIKVLLTRLFGAKQALLALEVHGATINSSESEANFDSESEDGNLDVDDDFDLKSVTHTDNQTVTCLELDHLDAAIKNCEAERDQLKDQNSESKCFKIELQKKLDQLKSLHTALQTNLTHHPLHLNKSTPSSYNRNIDWEIYWHWLTSGHENVQGQIVKLEKEFQEISAQLNDLKQMVDLEVMRNCLVVGLTTTGAARLHESLRALKAPIVLVEEAAEILESHVICSLTKHCQQVILIGDHKQLRPKPATYELEVNYNLNVSLFERIVNMREQCVQLVVQHRMRPEIAELISPSIYKKLQNHISVFKYPAIKGLEKNLFFLNHQNRESSSAKDGESMSNPFEVQFLLAFAKYLRLQGYEADEITILCTYSDQLLKFKQEKRSIPILRNVRVTTVDNYQGEENKIILLSLVRNNNNGNIGFLRMENRVCVALSRAREGLYIMGNMENLVMENEVWPKIKESLEANDAIGNCLVLKCQIHTDQLTKVTHPKDFENTPYGGCLLQCGATLLCGHKCKKVCHISDRDHEDYVCKEQCLRKCPRGHPCTSLCSVTCQPCKKMVSMKFECGHSSTLPCSTNPKDYHCTIHVPTLLHCGHVVQKPCYSDSNTYPCSQACNELLPCGHMCQKNCHIIDDPNHLKYVCKEDCKKIALNCLFSHPCPKKCHEPCAACTVKVGKKRFCGHTHKISCSQDVDKIICTRKCNRDLPCGHKCNLKCNLPCGRCGEMIEKIVPGSDHKVKVPCSEELMNEVYQGQCLRQLKCGHPCKAQHGKPCTERCEYPRPLPKPALCQHVFSVPCYKIQAGLAEYADKLLQHCSTPCNAQLPCGHVCSGTCGSCKQGRIHEMCIKPCSRILNCGHNCEALCKDSCPPCNKICSLKCQHTECKKKCSVSCTPCQKPCSWQCEHLQCKKLCFEICDREACNEPCTKLIKCGHPCIGFCSDPCPPLCRICDEKDLPDFIPQESKPHARFVFLPDCGHSIESNCLDFAWQLSCKIGIKICPLCKTRITYCARYTNKMKKDYENIRFVEYQQSLSTGNLRADQHKILNDINTIDQEYTVYFPGFKAHKKIFRDMGILIKRRKNISVSLLKDISTKLTVLGMILYKIKEISPISCEVDNLPVVINQMIILITSLPTHQSVSNQMADDIKNELMRLYYMVELYKFEKENGLNQDKYALQIEIIYLGLLNLKKFTKSSCDIIYKQMSEFRKLLKLSMPFSKPNNIKIKVYGLDQNDWYKCPNGHIYILECEKCLQSIPYAPVMEN